MTRRSRASSPTGETTPIAQVALSSLRPHPENPRRISRARLDQLKATLAADPAMLQARPLIALPDGTVIAGNQRLRAAVELGWTELPVVYADLDEQTARLWMLRDNNAFGDWDETPLAEMLQALGQGGVELALAGFEGQTVDALLRGLVVERPDADDVPPLPAKPRSKVGEVYELGPHRLMCGDATSRADVATILDGDRACLMLTDPPYGVLFGSARKNAIQGDLSQAVIPVSFALAVDEALDEDARLYLFGGSGNWSMYAKLFDYHLQQEPHPLVWVKESFVMRPNGYHSQFEMVYYGWKGKGGGSSCWFGDRKTSDVWAASRDRDGMHPTQKPVEACAIAVRNSAPVGGIVYDPFAGSGSTLIAADQLGRRCFAMEIDPGYCDVIRDRYAAWTATP